jgi:hypothetical protein
MIPSRGIPQLADYGYPEYRRTEEKMSSALWCDKGEHAFSAKDLNRQHFTQTQTVTVNTGNSYGRPTYQDRQEVTEELDICGTCWLKSNPFSAEETKPILEENGYTKETNQTEQYLKGYHDGILRREDD